MTDPASDVAMLVTALRQALEDVELLSRGLRHEMAGSHWDPELLQLEAAARRVRDAASALAASRAASQALN
ncbi:MAG: hypothetical protein M3R55_00805 [Acidobacteriota bacterium]|nr:hypothetical protein [Acidobacteriota bacterium]